MIIKDDEFADVTTPSGPMRTFVWRPVAPGRYPGLVVYSEIYQATPPIRRIAANFAGHGFVVAVPDIYHEFLPAGVALPYDEAGTARGNDLKIAKTIASYDDDARSALAFLKSHPNCTGALGVAGFCIGGHLAFRAAMNAEVRATACWYPTDIHEGSLGQGKKDNSLARIGDISGEMLMIFGRQDPHIPKEGRHLIYDSMTSAGLSFTWHEFNAAHAFMRDEGARYDPAVARICYGLALEMFHRRLGEGDRQA
jgi:carboxymethylenebutenolidase